MMEKYLLDPQYPKYLKQIGVNVEEALKKASLPLNLFSLSNPTLDERDYYRFMEAIQSQISDPSLPIQIASSDYK